MIHIFAVCTVLGSIADVHAISAHTSRLAIRPRQHQAKPNKGN
jgi:hypothetical protein